ncbi:uncharacterized protein CEXT_625751 [Caerostris extrusa]|uniref:Uncharacterized protein n=1 Tax=Caerostris extrusa TaxID=172846 RepID=A0AAV4M9C6_CAEEX|nr:uncharacterized protein CEXT_625751 [Caerostris extrusa]
MQNTLDLQSLQETPSSSSVSQHKESSITIKVYKRRLWMLFLFSLLSFLCAMLFPLYTSVANVTICYYKVSENAVNWTCLLHELVYIIFVFPISCLTKRIGLRNIVLLASLTNTLAQLHPTWGAAGDGEVPYGYALEFQAK